MSRGFAGPLAFEAATKRIHRVIPPTMSVDGDEVTGFIAVLLGMVFSVTERTVPSFSVTFFTRGPTAGAGGVCLAARISARVLPELFLKGSPFFDPCAKSRTVWPVATADIEATGLPSSVVIFNMCRLLLLGWAWWLEGFSERVGGHLVATG